MITLPTPDVERDLATRLARFVDVLHAPGARLYLGRRWWTVIHRLLQPGSEYQYLVPPGTRVIFAHAASEGAVCALAPVPPHGDHDGQLEVVPP